MILAIACGGFMTNRSRLLGCAAIAASLLAPGGAGGASAGQPVSDAMVQSAMPVGGNLVITMRSGKRYSIVPSDGLCSFDDVAIAPDHRTVGWIRGGDAEEAGSKPCAPDNQYVAGDLTIWRAGQVRHVFHEFGGAMSFRFWRGGDQVAYHVGPAHFDSAQTCGLYDSMTGRLLRTWSHLTKIPPPDWVKGIIDE